MIEDKEIPSEYISIRTIWLKGIDESRKALSQVANIESSSERKLSDTVGARTVVHTVDALHLSLVDYGEAMILSDVEKWREEYYIPEHDKIWCARVDKDGEKISSDHKWWEHVKLSQRLYRQIIQVLNKYNMLFPQQPKGYSNVIMEEITDGEKENE